MISLIITKDKFGYFFLTWDLDKKAYLTDKSTDFKNLPETETEIVLLAQKTMLSEVAHHFNCYKIQEQFIQMMEKDKKLKAEVEEYLSDIKKQILHKFSGDIYLSRNQVHYSNLMGLKKINKIENDNLKIYLKTIEKTSLEMKINISLANLEIINLNPLTYIISDNIYVEKKGSNRLKLFNNKDVFLISEKHIKIYADIISDFISNELIIPEDVIPLGYQIHLSERTVNAVPKYQSMKLEVFQVDTEIRPLLGDFQLVYQEMKTFFRHTKEKFLREALKEFNYSMEDSPETVVSWLRNHRDLLKEMNVQIFQKNCNYYLDDATIDFSLYDKIDWFDMKLVVMFGQYQVSVDQMKAALLKGNKTITLPNGQIAVIPNEWSKYFNPILSSSGGKVPKYIFLSEPEKDMQFKFSDIVHELPKIKGKFKNDAQIQGYQWLMNLDKSGISGLLADDMGMGKTFQVIAMLIKRKEKREKNAINRTLILAPLSVSKNWVIELEKFSDLTYQIIDASKNTINYQEKINTDVDIVIVTYQYFNRRSAEFLQHEWDYFILDEAQYIKNPTSGIYEEILKMTPQRKLCMTGTPIENNLVDLWAILNFLNPGLLGTKNWFKTNYINKIFDGDESVVKRLKDILKIVLLRRNKKDHLKLPDKLEHVIMCEMNEDQRSLYNEMKRVYQTKIYQGTNSFEVLRGLHVLRAISNHPKLHREESDVSSGKFQIIKDKIQELRGKKMLIFSQSVTYLEIMEKYLKEEKIKYLFLHGETKKREIMVKEFADEDVECFLISIKAGGVGINLTSAENVLILDPLWNPSVENQAIDRAYRIGQENEVNVYRFITRNSVEEKIRDLQDKKRKLSGLLNAEVSIGSLTKAEMETIFN